MTLLQLGITHQQIADKLEKLSQLFKKGQFVVLDDDDERLSFDIPFPSFCASRRMQQRMPNPVLVENKFIMLAIKTKGYQGCPFSGCKGCGSDDYSILNINNKKSCKFSDLVIHLIRDHEFFEGDVEYRVDPQAAVDCWNSKQE
jgi:hypothetical protein